MYRSKTKEFSARQWRALIKLGVSLLPCERENVRDGSRKRRQARGRGSTRACAYEGARKTEGTAAYERARTGARNTRNAREIVHEMSGTRERGYGRAMEVRAHKVSARQSTGAGESASKRVGAVKRQRQRGLVRTSSVIPSGQAQKGPAHRTRETACGTAHTRSIDGGQRRVRARCSSERVRAGL
jgi:hypothetical protein